MNPLLSSHEALSEAINAAPLLRGLGATTRAALAAAATPRLVPPGAALFPEGAGADALYLICEGRFHAYEPDPPRPPRLVRTLGPGDVVDGLLELGGGRHPLVAVATEPGTVAVIPGDVVDALVGVHDDLRLARDRLHRLQLLSRLSRVFGPIDGALLDALEAEADWTHMHRGEVLWETGAAADGLYFVISGRVAVLHVYPNGTEELQYEVGRGETLGEGGFFDGQPHTHRVRALRDSLLVGYTAQEFERLIAGNPHIVRHITAGVAARAASPGRRARVGAALTTVALVAASDRAPVATLSRRLADALSVHGSVLRLNADRVDEMLTEPGIAHASEDSPEEQRLLAWLDECETRHRFVIYECDVPGAWSRRCVRRSDRLLLVADARDPWVPVSRERAVVPVAGGVGEPRATLVLVHPEGTAFPAGTSRWLDARPDVSEHLHLRWNHDADLQRLARVVAGRSVGLVLGGGGARGFAHIGLLRALAGAGIPIDAIGGTSMGASVAGQFAMGRDPDAITATSRKVFLELKPHRGFTIPFLSLVNSRRTELAGRIFYGDVEIEDLWLPFFCVSSNLTTADVMVHRRGTLWKAALASSSLPGIGTPVLHERHLLVDGAVLNNLPTDVMRRMGHGTVIASVVSVEDTATFTCERVPTTWEAMRSRFDRRSSHARFPSLLEVVLRSSLLHSAYRERMSVLEADLAVRPAVEAFGLLEFERIDDIVEAGFQIATATIARWREEAVPIFT